MHPAVRTVARDHSRVGTASWLLVLVLAQLAALVVVYVVFVRTTTGQRLEAAALAGNVIGYWRIGGVVGDVLGVISVATLAAATGVIGFIALVRRRFTLAFVSVLVIGGANLTTQVLKHGLLTRPRLVEEWAWPNQPSLPSGHTTVAMSVAVALVLVLPPRLRGIAAIAAAAYAGVTGIATLSAGWHRPSDAVAAFLVVGIWAAFGGLVLLGAQTRAYEPRQTEAHPVSVTFLGFFGTLLIGVGGFAMLLADRTVVLPVIESGRWPLFVSYAGSAAGIAGVAALVMALLIVSLHRVVPHLRS